MGWGGAAAFLAEFCALGGRATQYQLPFFGLTHPAPSPPTSGGGVAVFASSLLTPERWPGSSPGGRHWARRCCWAPASAKPGPPPGVAQPARRRDGSPAYPPETQASYVAATPSRAHRRPRRCSRETRSPGVAGSWSTASGSRAHPPPGDEGSTRASGSETPPTAGTSANRKGPSTRAASVSESPRPVACSSTSREVQSLLICATLSGMPACAEA
jgi:hypothetical protein